VVELEKKRDCKRELKEYYGPSSVAPEIVNIPAFKYLMVDGIGMDFENGASQDAIQALFGVAYKAKFMLKREQGIDYGVMPLEGLWWSDDMGDFINGNREQWRWTYMIMQPEFVTADIIQAAMQAVKASKKSNSLDLMRFESFHEGLAAQILHIGPFAEEHPNIMKIHRFIAENEGVLDGKHHEIYLSDFRKTDPSRLKTVLRQPFVGKAQC
jgi:Uncharacterized conserved protein